MRAFIANPAREKIKGMMQEAWSRDAEFALLQLLHCPSVLATLIAASSLVESMEQRYEI